MQKEEISLGTRLICAASEHAAWIVMHISYLHKQQSLYMVIQRAEVVLIFVIDL